MSSTLAAAPAGAVVANPRSRVILASLIGTTIEFYDFYVYATAAVLVFPHLFFPAGNDTTALLASFAVFGAAMVARPLGAIFFGHLGDRRGRKATLVGALLTMGIATFLLYQDAALGAVMTLAMILNLLVAALMGVIIPMTMSRLGRDPAVGASVMITAITDTGGFFIFLGLATLFLL